MPQTSHMFPHTYSASYPNASNLPENLHFIGASSRGTPSPNASGLAIGAADAQNGSQEETIDIDDDDTLEPTRFILCTLSVPQDWGTPSYHVKTRVVISNYVLKS